jgi:hypothetical protein
MPCGFGDRSSSAQEKRPGTCPGLSNRVARALPSAGGSRGASAFNDSQHRRRRPAEKRWGELGRQLNTGLIQAERPIQRKPDDPMNEKHPFDNWVHPFKLACPSGRRSKHIPRACNIGVATAGAITLSPGYKGAAGREGCSGPPRRPKGVQRAALEVVYLKAGMISSPISLIVCMQLSWEIRPACTIRIS